MVQIIKRIGLILPYCILSVSLLKITNLGATQLTYTQNTSSTNQLALGYPVPIPVESQTPIDGFRDYDALFARHQDLMLSSELIDGQVIGQTIEGENIWAYILSDGDSFTNEGIIPEGAMLQNGGIHSREWQTPEVVTGILERFSDKQNDNGFYQYLLENTKIVLIPSLNISGFRQTQRYPTKAIRSTDVSDSSSTPRDGRMRRKNMRNVDLLLSTESDFLNGIDLNRNNDPFWASSPTRSSPRVTSIVHHGSGPASEPEIQALQAAAVLAGENRLRFYIDTHSFTRIYFTPMTGNSRRDAITTNIAANMRAVNNNRYAYGPLPAGAGIGATDEYFAETYQIPSYTLETEPGQGGGTDYGGFGVSHDGFILPNSEISRVTEELANASILGYYMQAGPPSVAKIMITNTDSDQVIFEGQWVVNNASKRQWIEVTNTALEPNKNYDFWVSFNKPMRWRNNDVIGNYPGQNVTINPQVVIEGIAASGEAFSETLTTSQGAWLNQSGGSPSGFNHYQDDTFSFSFLLSANSPVLAASLVQLAITTQDLAQQNLDASPASVIDWTNGAWSNYESSNGNLADSGGTDRVVRLIDDGSAGFVVPQADAPPPPQPVPITPPLTDVSSGGGSSHLIILLLLGLALWHRNSMPKVARLS